MGSTYDVILARFSRVGGMQFPNHDCSRCCQGAESPGYPLGAEYLRKSRWISYPLIALLAVLLFWPLVGTLLAGRRRRVAAA
jgi:hypothetical protein